MFFNHKYSPYVKFASKVVFTMLRCFLLTPKLLSDLEYSEACSVINVMNGPWIEQSSKGYFAYVFISIFVCTIDYFLRLFSLNFNKV